MKKLLLFFAVLLTAVKASAYNFEVGGFYYNILSYQDLTCEVTYKDEGYNSYSRFVIIPSTVNYSGVSFSVTKIGSSAFYECWDLISVEIPNSVTTIGNYAFSGCTSLTAVEIPNSVTTIGSDAFSGCTSLTAVEIPNSVTTIGDFAFSGCSSLPVENNLRYVGTYLVEAVDKTLSTYTIKEGTKWIGSNAFAGCKSLTSIEIPNSVTTIEKGAFWNCSNLTSVVIGNSVMWIGESAFAFCSSLISVEIPNSVTKIEMNAFQDCSSLTTVEIPNSVTEIGRVAFGHCYLLESFTGKFASDDHRCLIIDGVLNSFAPAGLASYEIPNSVTTIENNAFADCPSLTSVVIPSSVTKIGDYAFAAVFKLSNLTEIISLNSTPPSVGISSFNRVPSSCVLKVPTEAVEAYKYADGWKEFQNIVSLSDFVTPVSAPEAKTVANGKTYNLQGMEVPEGYRGIVIRNGKKILRK